jgi:hypothetical protein
MECRRVEKAAIITSAAAVRQSRERGARPDVTRSARFGRVWHARSRGELAFGVLEQAVSKVSEVTLGFLDHQDRSDDARRDGRDWVTMSLNPGSLIGSAIFAIFFLGLVCSSGEGRIVPAVLALGDDRRHHHAGTTLADFARIPRRRHDRARMPDRPSCDQSPNSLNRRPRPGADVCGAVAGFRFVKRKLCDSAGNGPAV